MVALTTALLAVTASVGLWFAFRSTSQDPTSTPDNRTVPEATDDTPPLAGRQLIEPDTSRNAEKLEQAAGSVAPPPHYRDPNYRPEQFPALNIDQGKTLYTTTDGSVRESFLLQIGLNVANIPKMSWQEGLLSLPDPGDDTMIAGTKTFQYDPHSTDIDALLQLKCYILDEQTGTPINDPDGRYGKKFVSINIGLNIVDAGHITSALAEIQAAVRRFESATYTKISTNQPAHATESAYTSLIETLYDIAEHYPSKKRLVGSSQYEIWERQRNNAAEKLKKETSTSWQKKAALQAEEESQTAGKQL